LQPSLEVYTLVFAVAVPLLIVIVSKKPKSTSLQNLFKLNDTFGCEDVFDPPQVVLIA
jgi:hypothetical protein